MSGFASAICPDSGPAFVSIQAQNRDYFRAEPVTPRDSVLERPFGAHSPRNPPT